MTDTGEDRADSGAVGPAALRGSIALLTRQVVTFGLSFGSSIVLARVLRPADIGFVALLIFVAAFGRLISDGGLATGLVRYQSDPTNSDFDTAFWSQTVLGVVGAITVSSTAPLVADHFKSVHGASSSLAVTSIAFLGTPALSIATVKLERRLRFSAVGAILTVQPVVFAIGSIVMATVGAGVFGVAVALAISHVAPVPMALRFSRHTIGRSFSLVSLRQQARFGVPFLCAESISALKDAIVPVFIGLAFGAAAAGYVTWAQQAAALGVYLLFVISRLLFAVFARLMHDIQRASAAISQILFWTNTFVAIPTCFMMFFSAEFTRMIYGPTWLESVDLLRVLLISNLTAASASVILAALNASGRARIALAFSVAWFASTWALVPPAVARWGIIGYGVANVTIQIVTIALLVYGWSVFRFAWVRETIAPWATAATLAALTATLARSRNANLEELLPLVSLGVIYLTACTIIFSVTFRSRVGYTLGLFRA